MQQHTADYEALIKRWLTSFRSFVMLRQGDKILVDIEALDALVPYHLNVGLRICRSVRKIYRQEAMKQVKYPYQTSFRALAGGNKK